MKRIKILKQGIQTHGAELPTSEADSWIADCVANNYWGQPGEYEIVVEDLTQEIEAEKQRKRQLEIDETLRKVAREQLKGDVAKISDPNVRAALQKIEIILSKWN